jgi:Predicted transcriptional regulator
MVRLRVIEILNEKGRTKYWLYKQMGMSYQNFSKMVNNTTKSIKYDNLDTLCQILECTPSELFDYNPNK